MSLNFTPEKKQQKYYFFLSPFRIETHSYNRACSVGILVGSVMSLTPLTGWLSNWLTSGSLTDGWPV